MTSWTVAYLCLWDSPSKNIEQVAISFFSVSSRPRDGTRVSCKWIASGFFTTDLPGRPILMIYWRQILLSSRDLLVLGPLSPGWGWVSVNIFEKPATHLLTALLLACSVQSLLSQAVLPVLQVPPVCEDHSEEKTSGKSTLCSNMMYLTISRKTMQHALRSHRLCLLLITLFDYCLLRKKMTNILFIIYI